MRQTYCVSCVGTVGAVKTLVLLQFVQEIAFLFFNFTLIGVAQFVETYRVLVDVNGLP